VQRHENRVLTNQSSSPPQAISWTWTLPVTWHARGMKQASCSPRGSSLAVTAGMRFEITNSATEFTKMWNDRPPL
jgi:hypothetical protein